MSKKHINKEDFLKDPKEQIIDFRDIGATGLRRFSGFVFEEFLEELLMWKGAAIWKEMSWNDPVVASMLYAVKMLIRKVDWWIEPASDAPFDKEAAEFLESCMHDMSQSWTDTIDEQLSFLEYGYSVHEIVYKRRCGNVLDPSMRSKHSDGRIGWRKLPTRSQDTIYRWQFDDHGGIQGVEQLAPPHYYHVTIPVEKMLLFRTRIEKNNPEGRSILRGAYRPWYLKKNIQNIEAIGIERDLAGLPCALVPPELLSANASNAQKQILANIEKIVTNIRRDEQEGVIFPQQYDATGKPIYELKLLSTGGQRQFDTDKIIQRYNQEIAMTMLADFLFLGHSNTGSYALGSSKISLFGNGVSAILDIMCSVYNRYAIPRLFALNDFQISDFPQLKHGDVENVDLQQLGNYITQLAGSGMPLFPNEELEKYLMKVAKLPEPMTAQMQSMGLDVYPQPKEMPEKITEIPSTPGQVPTGMNTTPDTTPVNQKPPVTTVTNPMVNPIEGNTERQTAYTRDQETGEALRNSKRINYDY